jgi:hypothetical protein
LIPALYTIAQLKIDVGSSGSYAQMQRQCLSVVHSPYHVVQRNNLYMVKPYRRAFHSVFNILDEFRKLTFSSTQGGQRLHPPNSSRCPVTSFKDRDAKRRRRSIKKSFGETSAPLLTSRIEIRELYAPATLVPWMKHRHPLSRRLTGPCSRCERCGTEKNLLLLIWIKFRPSGP